MATVTYAQHAEDPAYVFRWLDYDNQEVDLSTATWELKLVTVDDEKTVVLTKTSGISYETVTVGGKTVQLVTVQWATGELATVPPGTYQPWVTPTVSSRQRTPAKPDIIVIEATPVTP